MLWVLSLELTHTGIGKSLSNPGGWFIGMICVGDQINSPITCDMRLLSMASLMNNVQNNFLFGQQKTFGLTASHPGGKDKLGNPNQIVAPTRRFRSPSSRIKTTFCTNFSWMSARLKKPYWKTT